MFSIMKKVLLFLSIVSVALMSFTIAPKPTVYNVDAAKSTFKWTGKKVTGQHWGNINFSAGQVTTDGNNILGGTFTVDMGSISVKDLEPAKGGDKLLGHIKSDDFFGVDKFATSTLTIKKATSKGGNNYDVVADLTIKGTTAEITFPATITKDATSLTAQASFKVNRTKYGIKYGSGSFFDNLGDKAISDDFDVEVNIAAMAAAPAAPAATVKKTVKKAATTTVKKKAATSSK
jgi:polyisoprenoid-binding protein YceI